MAQKTAWDGAALTESDINTYLMGEGGAWTTWTPAVTQSGSVTVTNLRSTYGRWGRLIIATYRVSVTGSGTGSNAITVSLPVTAAASGTVLGSAYLSDSSSSIIYPAYMYATSTSVVQLWRAGAEGTGVSLGSSGFTAALASGDVLAGTMIYEAAS